MEHDHKRLICPACSANEIERMRLGALVESEARRAEDAHGEAQRWSLTAAHLKLDLDEAESRIQQLEAALAQRARRG